MLQPGLVPIFLHDPATITKPRLERMLVALSKELSGLVASDELRARHLTKLLLATKALLASLDHKDTARLHIVAIIDEQVPSPSEGITLSPSLVSDLLLYLDSVPE